MASYEVSVVSEDHRPLVGVEVEAVSLNNWPNVSNVQKTGRNGTVFFTGLIGPHFFRPRHRRVSGKVGERTFTGAVKVQVVSIGEGLNVDYVVDSNGMGTHTKLFGSGGALEAAVKDQADRVIWVCSSHSETVTASHVMDTLTNRHRITVMSGGRDRPVINCNFTGALIQYNPSAQVGTSKRLRFEGLTFNAASGQTVDFYENIATADESPHLELSNCSFTGQGTWRYIQKGDTVAATLAGMTLDRVDGTFTALGVTRSDASVSSADPARVKVRNCDLTLTNIVTRVNNTDVELGVSYEFEANILKVLDYGLRVSYALTTPVKFVANLIDHDGNAEFVRFGTAASTGAQDLVMVGNYYDGTGGGASTTFLLFAPASGSGEAISVVGNSLAGPASATAITLNAPIADGVILNSYRGWGTEIGGTNPTNAGVFTGDHGSLAGLADDDHTQYLLADGSRQLSADWNAGGFRITSDELALDQYYYLRLLPGGNQNFGNINVGANTFGVADQQQDAVKVTLPTGHYTSISAYGNINILTREAKFAIYTDNAGAPGSLVAYTDPVVVNTTPQWWTANIAYDAAGSPISGIDLTGGTYWISIFSRGGGGFTFTWYYDTGGTSYDANPNTWPTPEDPWSGGAAGTRNTSLYITGEPKHPRIEYDSGDFLEFNRQLNTWGLYVGSAQKFAYDGGSDEIRYPVTARFTKPAGNAAGLIVDARDAGAGQVARIDLIGHDAITGIDWFRKSSVDTRIKFAFELEGIVAQDPDLVMYRFTGAGGSETKDEAFRIVNSTGNILIPGSKEINIRDTAIKLRSSVDGKLTLEADAEVENVVPAVSIKHPTGGNAQLFIQADYSSGSHLRLAPPSGSNRVVLTTGTNYMSMFVGDGGVTEVFRVQHADGVFNVREWLDIGTGNSVDNDVLLRFSMDRAWQFEVDGEDAASRLVLRNLVPDKTFAIQSNDSTDVFSVQCRDVTDPGSLAIWTDCRIVYTPSKQTLAADSDQIKAISRIVEIQSSAGSLTLTSVPTIANGTDGQVVTIINVDTVNSITLQDESVLAGSNLRLPGGANLTLGPRDVVTLYYSADLGDWVAVGSSNN